jgi:hypothetical protein
VCLVVSAGCAGASSPSGGWEGDPDSIVAKLCDDKPKKNVASHGGLSPEEAELRRRGIAALRSGRIHKARDLFDEALELAPNNVSLTALSKAADDALARSGEDASKTFDRTAPVKMKRASGRSAAEHARPPRLARLRKIPLSTYERLGVHDLRPLDTSQLPEIPHLLRRRQSLTGVFAHPDHGILIYGAGTEGTVAHVKGERVRLADYAGYVAKKDAGGGWRVTYAVVAGDVMYAALLVGSQNFIAANDLRDGKPLWRSERTAVNTNFVLVGDYVVTTRTVGSNNELVALSRHTGRELAHHPLSIVPSYLTQKNGIVFARSWADDIEAIQLEQGGDAALAKILASETAPLPDERARVFAFKGPSFTAIASAHTCAVDQALRDIDAGDYEAANARLTALESVYPHHSLVVSLAAASRHMQRETDEAVDLSRVRPRELQSIPIPIVPAAPSTDELVKVGGGPAEDLPVWAERLGLEQFSIQPDALPTSIPRSFGTHPISEWTRAEDGHVAIYGRRFVVVMKKNRVEAAFDAMPLINKANTPKLKLSGVQGVHFARRKGQTLFINWTTQPYGGGIAAVDLSTGRLRWRSETEVQAVNFVLTRDHIVMTASSRLLLLDQKEGSLLNEKQLDATPRALAVSGGRVLVNGDNGIQEFEIGAAPPRAKQWNGSQWSGG